MWAVELGKDRRQGSWQPGSPQIPFKCVHLGSSSLLTGMDWGSGVSQGCLCPVFVVMGCDLSPQNIGEAGGATCEYTIRVWGHREVYSRTRQVEECPPSSGHVTAQAWYELCFTRALPSRKPYVISTS